MKKALVFVLSLISGITYSQTSIQFRLKKAFNIKLPDNLVSGYTTREATLEFGGISAIEYDETSKKWYMASDRYGDYYVFQDSISNSTVNWHRDTNLKYLESFRFYKGKIYFTNEKDDDSTSIISYNLSKPSDINFIKTTCLDREKFNDRGYESLTIMNDSTILFCLESCTSLQNDSPFNSFIKYDHKNKNEEEFYYPFDKYGISEKFTGQYGNGISEILKLSDNSILILERCFSQDRKNKVQLFEGVFDEKKHIISKNLILSFNNFGTGFPPQNIEGMTWGPKKIDGKRTLYLVSDDNFNSELQTQIFILEEI